MDGIMIGIVGIGVIAVGGILFYASTAHSSVNIDDLTDTVKTDKQILEDVYNEYKSKFSRVITLDMLHKMWGIESNFSDPNYMFRPESGLPASQVKWSLYNGTGVQFDDASLGALQVLTGTANWLYTDMGYKGEGKPTLESLNKMRQNVYFAMSYLDYLARRAIRNGITPSERFLVMSYNGGYGANNSQTNNHYRKYLNAKGF